MRLKQNKAVYIFSLLTIWLVMPVAHSASSSANHSITRQVISSSGIKSSSLNYTNQNVVGQTAVGMITNLNSTLHAGFLSTSDTDGDGIFNNVDNCVNDVNPQQLDEDGDAAGNVCDLDDDGDGLSDVLEATLGTNSLLIDTDNDGLNDFDEVNFDGDINSYQAGIDTNPTNDDTDADGLLDGFDSLPLIYAQDGDLAPRGAPDGIINAADVFIANQIVLGEISPTIQDVEHGDIYPPGNPDGTINIQDLLLIQNKVIP